MVRAPARDSPPREWKNAALNAGAGNPFRRWSDDVRTDAQPIRGEIPFRIKTGDPEKMDLPAGRSLRRREPKEITIVDLHLRHEEVVIGGKQQRGEEVDREQRLLAGDRSFSPGCLVRESDGFRSRPN